MFLSKSGDGGLKSYITFKVGYSQFDSLKVYIRSIVLVVIRSSYGPVIKAMSIEVDKSS